MDGINAIPKVSMELVESFMQLAQEINVLLVILVKILILILWQYMELMNVLNHVQKLMILSKVILSNMEIIAFIIKL